MFQFSLTLLTSKLQKIWRFSIVMLFVSRLPFLAFTVWCNIIVTMILKENRKLYNQDLAIFIIYYFQRRNQNPVKIYNGAFCENCLRLKAATYFRKKLHLGCLTRFWICLWLSLISMFFSIINLLKLIKISIFQL